jgi:hypothetical protein
MKATTVSQRQLSTKEIEMSALATAIRIRAGDEAREGARDNIVVRFWLHAEGLAAFAGATALYLASGGDGWLFLPLLLVPDLGLLGYVLGSRFGAFTYNLVHNWAIGLGVLGIGLAMSSTGLVLAGAILIAHVGMDRAVGYGLKYPGAPKPTHLQRV